MKAIHIVFMVSWMAGLLYLPRLFVYHADALDEVSHKRFLVMERRLYFGIMWPAMVVTATTGIWMLVQGWSAFNTGLWIHWKLLFVAILMAYHFLCWKWYAEFRENKRIRTSKFFRLINEIPAVLLLVITILVVVKP